MGQYFLGFMQQGNTIRTFDNNIKYTDKDGVTTNEYTFLKLTEHSWWESAYVNAIAKKLYNRKARLAWVGDYTEEEVVSSDGTKCPIEPKNMYHLGTYDDNDKFIPMKKDGYRIYADRKIKFTEGEFTLNDKFYVNYSRKEYIDLNAYYKRSAMKDDWEGWCQSPISLMTATSNGMGMGDYNTDAICAAYVGLWAYDVVSIKDKAPKGFKLLNVTFNEHIELPVQGVA